MRYNRTVKDDFTVRVGDETENGTQSRGFARTVTADQCDGFARTDVKATSKRM